MKIGVNCGHTVSRQPGCGAVGYLDESVETRKVGKELMALLRAAGHTVYDCTNDYAKSVNDNLNQIVAMANKQSLDLFVSIHFNAGGGQGTEVWTYGGKQHAEAVKICNHMNQLGFKNRGVKDGSKLAVVRKSNAKAILIEVCFVDTQSDAALYQKVGHAAVAKALYKAITGQEYTAPTATTNKSSEEEIDMEELKNLQQRVEKLERKVSERTGYFNYIDKNMPKDYKPTIQKLVDKGKLHGNEKGELMLTVDMMRILTVFDRFGYFDKEL